MKTLRSVYCAAVAAFAVSLVGCSGMNRVRNQTYGDLERAQVCCSSLADIQYESIEFSPKRFSIDVKSSAFRFDTGKSFFKAFAFPDIAEGLRVKVTSYSNQMVGGYFQPDLLLLDADHRVIRRLDSLLLASPNVARTGIFETSISADFAISKAEGGARYLVIRTTDDLLAARIPSSGRVNMVAGPGFVIPLDVKGSSTQWPEGEIQIEIAPSIAP